MHNLIGQHSFGALHSISNMPYGLPNCSHMASSWVLGIIMGGPAHVPRRRGVIKVSQTCPSNAVHRGHDALQNAAQVARLPCVAHSSRSQSLRL